MNKDKKRQLEGGVNLDVQPGNGTRYDIIAMLDPNGGVLVCWPITGWTYRYFSREKGYAPNEGFMQSEIKQLGRDGCRNEYDMEAIKTIMDNWFEDVIQ